MHPKLEFNPDNLVYIPDDPLALRPITDIFPDGTALDTIKPSALNESMSFEAEFTGTINTSLFKELAGIDSKPQKGFQMEYNCERLEQVKRHKKKRINKKWAKRYGYRFVPCKILARGCHIRQNTHGDIDVIFDSEVIIKGGK